MIIVGFFFAIISGLIIPIEISLFGKILDIFIYHSNAITEVDNTSISPLAQSFALSYNVSCDTLLQQEPSVVENITNTSSILCLSQDHRILRNIMNMACEPGPTLQSEVQRFAYYLLIIALTYFLTTFFGMLFFNASAYRQTRRLRQTLYHSILHQEIGWFDLTDAKKLNSCLLE